ncbi:hypothetical protein [Porcipelethomonas sp.]|uniref:hypothetical protein n=1 Tax=Porcipelethomonas sp. TaxID=2981675 RepID=UPI003EFA085C
MNGNKINSVKELKQNFCIDELIYYFYSGELEMWLRKIGEDYLADKLSGISRNGYLLIELYNLFDLDVKLTEEEIQNNTK